MLIDIEGIVLDERSFGESSKILNVITPKYGVIGVIAKGSKKIKSPLCSVTSRLTYGRFYLYYKEGKLSVLSNVDVIDSFKIIKKDLKRLSYAFFLLELAGQVMKQNKVADIYNLLIACLLKINDGFDPLVITNILELKYLDYLGVMPVIDRCLICNSVDNIVTISSYKGGYLCKNCCGNEVIVSLKTIKLIRMFYYVDILKIVNLQITDGIIKEINRFLNEYYERYTGLYLKSKGFLEQINN